MQKITLFDKEIKVKDYDCSFNKNVFNPKPVNLNLYVQVTDVCNAKCQFCDKPGCKDNDFDYDKFEYVFKEVYQRGITNYVSLTGGEPFLNLLKLDRILNIIYKIAPDIAIEVNTNGYNLNAAKNLNIYELHISRHHYDDYKNSSVFKTSVPSLESLKSFSKQFKGKQIIFNCVLQKGLIDNIDELKLYLDRVSLTGIEKVNFIGMMPLTDNYSQLYVDPTPMIQELMSMTNAGLLYDKNICECLNSMYISSYGIPIIVNIKNNKKHICNYTRQLVYTANNKLISGFGGQEII